MIIFQKQQNRQLKVIRTTNFGGHLLDQTSNPRTRSRSSQDRVVLFVSRTRTIKYIPEHQNKTFYGHDKRTDHNETLVMLATSLYC